VDVVASLVELDERELVTAIVRDVTESRELEPAACPLLATTSHGKSSFRRDATHALAFAKYAGIPRELPPNR